MNPKKQNGIASIAAILAIIGAVVIGGTGYLIYQSQHKKQTTNATTMQNPSSTTVGSYTGTVTKVDCTKAGAGCSEYVLKTNDTSYNLSDGNLDKYVNLQVIVQGQLSQQTPNSTIVVNSIQPLDTPVTGTLKGQVVCVQKVGEQPCESSFRLDEASRDPAMGSYKYAQTVQADARGNFEVALSPGKYEIHPSTKTGYPVIVPINNPITITAGETTTVKITYMDGTR